MFDHLNVYYMSAHSLQCYNWNLQKFIQTDAFDLILLHILSEFYNKILRSYTFLILKTYKKERSNDFQRKEMLTVITCVKPWPQYWEGLKFKVVPCTNDANLQYCVALKSYNGRKTRWTEELYTLHFNIIHRVG